MGIEHDRLASDDKSMLHLAQVVRNGLGDRASTGIDRRTEVVQGKTVCLVSCRRSPEPAFLRWKRMEKEAGGDFYARSGPGSIWLSAEDAAEYVRTRFPAVARVAGRVVGKDCPSGTDPASTCCAGGDYLLVPF